MTLRNKQILITGGTGFIGSAIVNKLLSQENNLNIICHPNDSTWRINDLNKCKIYKIDLCDHKNLNKSIHEIQPEIIFHLAGTINPERDLIITHKVFSTNLTGLQNLLIALNNYDYELFINTGSSDEYGKNLAPFKESDRESPVSPYSASKVAATYFCKMISNIYDKSIITVRPFLPYGPKQITRALIPSLLFACIYNKKLSLTACEQTRDFIYIEDVADAYISLAESANRVKKMGIFNIGSGKEVKIIKIVNLIKSQFNTTSLLIGDKDYRAGEMMHHFSSIEKIKNAIGWEPKWSIEDGINATIKWWQNNKDAWIRNADIFD